MFPDLAKCPWRSPSSHISTLFPVRTEYPGLVSSLAEHEREGEELGSSQCRAEQGRAGQGRGGQERPANRTWGPSSPGRAQVKKVPGPQGTPGCRGRGMTSPGKCPEGVLQLSQGLVTSPPKAEVWRRQEDEEGESHLPSASEERNGLEDNRT